MVKVEAYKSFDGQLFQTQVECEAYENSEIVTRLQFIKELVKSTSWSIRHDTHELTEATRKLRELFSLMDRGLIDNIVENVKKHV